MFCKWQNDYSKHAVNVSVELSPNVRLILLNVIVLDFSNDRRGIVCLAVVNVADHKDHLRGSKIFCIDHESPCSLYFFFSRNRLEWLVAKSDIMLTTVFY